MLRSFLIFLFVLIVCAVAVGFYRGWFTLSSSRPNAGSNKVDLNLSVDPDKIQKDSEAVKKSATALPGKLGAQPAKSGTTEPPDR